jgi:hypothetical protein
MSFNTADQHNTSSVDNLHACYNFLASANAQNITIMVTAYAPGNCDTTKQQQLTAAVLQEVSARTAKEHAADIAVNEAVCSTSDSRRRQVKTSNLLSTYTVLASTVGLLDDFSTLQASLQQALGSVFSKEAALCRTVKPLS